MSLWRLQYFFSCVKPLSLLYSQNCTISTTRRLGLLQDELCPGLSANHPLCTVIRWHPPCPYHVSHEVAAHSGAMAPSDTLTKNFLFCLSHQAPWKHPEVSVKRRLVIHSDHIHKTIFKLFILKELYIHRKWQKCTEGSPVPFAKFLQFIKLVCSLAEWLLTNMFMWENGK